LSQAHITQTHIHQGLQLARNHRYGAEEFERLLDRHFQHFGDVLALVVHFQRFAVVALAVADVARHIDIGQEVHFHLDHAIALTGFAATALDVKAEAPRPVAAFARHRYAGVKLADRRKEAGVGRRVRARRAADRALVDIDDLVEMRQPMDRFIRRRFGIRAIEFARGDGVQGVVNQRRFARAGHAGHTDQEADRQHQVNILEVVARSAFDLQPLFRIGDTALFGDVDLAHARQKLPGD